MMSASEARTIIERVRKRSMRLAASGVKHPEGFKQLGTSRYQQLRGYQHSIGDLLEAVSSAIRNRSDDYILSRNEERQVEEVMTTEEKINNLFPRL